MREHVGDEALALAVLVKGDVSDALTRSDILAVLRCGLSTSLETELLCDHLQEMWETIDLLTERFGRDLAHKMVLAPSLTLLEFLPS